jgi:hypothetical protein
MTRERGQEIILVRDVQQFFFPWSGLQLTSYAEIPAPSSCPQRDRWVKLKVELLGNLRRELVLEKRSLECLEVKRPKLSYVTVLSGGRVSDALVKSRKSLRSEGA